MTSEEEATSALINTQPRQGAKIPKTGVAAEWDLIGSGHIGKRGGLTRKGSIARERAMRALEDEAFGA